jgi:hypothetical protein
MIRYGLGILLAAGTCGAFAVSACGSDIEQGQVGGTGGVAGNTGGAPAAGATTGATGGSSGAGGGGVSTGLKCEGECCPTDATCYSDPTKVAASPGSECLATRDNTGKDHIQVRQQWISATKPIGNTSSVVYQVLSGRSQLPQPVCNQGTSTSALLGSGGYIQIIDYYLPGGAAAADISAHYAVNGFAKFVDEAGLSAALNNGLCFVTDAYQGKEGYTLPSDKMAPAARIASWKAGLPKPMGIATAPWAIKPAKAKRLDKDFDIVADRDALLARFADGGDLKTGGFDGVFFYDATTGKSHAYAPMSWVVVYGKGGTDHISIPIRETELTGKFNDPAAPNCIGAYRTNSLTVANKCESGDPKNPPWGCYKDSCPAGTGPGTTGGYFLISELDQVYSSDLGATLCTTYPPPGEVQTQGFFDATTKSCQKSPKWDPTAADDAGIPNGDWCSQTNAAATATCHDAWRSETYHVFSGAKIQGPAADGPIVTCPI